MQSEIRNRIIEFKTIKAKDLLDNEGNWRLHPRAQKDAMDGILNEIGIADSLLAYHSERNGGALTLIDGHLRKSINPEQEWSVQVTDLNDKEADLLLSMLDPLAGLAQMDANKYLELMEQVNTDDWAIREVLRKLSNEADELLEQVHESEDGEEDGRELPAMELLPFEHYDYVMVMFKNELDWLRCVDLLGLERRQDPRRTPKAGLSRVINGSRLIRLLEDQQHADSHSE